MNLSDIKTERDLNNHYLDPIWSEAAREICVRHKISYDELKRSDPCEHIVFFIDDSFVLKIYDPFGRGFEREKIALDFVDGKTSLKTPEIVAEGSFEGFEYLIQTRIPGDLLDREKFLALAKNEQVPILEQLASGLKELHSHDADLLEFDWNVFIEGQVKNSLQKQIEAGTNEQILKVLPQYIEENLKLFPKNRRHVFLHGDVHFGNLRFQKINGIPRISGLFDFSDSLKGFHEYDFLATGVLMIQGRGELQREFFKAYGYAESDLDESFRRQLMLLTILHEASELRRFAERLRPEAIDYSLEKLEKGIWSFV